MQLVLKASKAIKDFRAKSESQDHKDIRVHRAVKVIKVILGPLDSKDHKEIKV